MIEVKLHTTLRRQLNADVRAIRSQHFSFKDCLENYFDCLVEVTAYTAGLPRDYIMYFNDPKQEFFFRLRYAEYL
jgi:hypothetical protein